MLTRCIALRALCLLAALAMAACGARTEPGGSRRGDGGGATRRDRGVPSRDFTVDLFRLDRSVPAPDIGVRPQSACTNPTDFPKLRTDALRDQVEGRADACAIGCLGNPDADCALDCIRKETGLTVACSTCWAEAVRCAIERCLAQCAADPSSPACGSCRDINCRPAFTSCTGLP